MRLLYKSNPTFSEEEKMMKIQKWLFWIICLSLISSCSLPPDKETDGTVPQFPQTGQVEPVTPDDSQDKSLQVAQTDNGTVPSQNETVEPVAPERDQEDNDPVTQLAEKAQQGDADAQNKLGLMYLNGKEGVTQNDIEAAKWFHKAAEQEHADAQFYLGVMYYSGKGVTQNDIEAAKWYRKAAEQGHADAQNILGLMYGLGKGVTQNDIEAAKWYRKAAEQGHAKAQFNLGARYDNGEGVTENDIEAVNWYRKAAEQGHAKAQFNLGVMYGNGEGVTENDIEAAKWYRKAAEQGHAKAQFNLGAMYDNGEGVTQNDIEAVKWYRKAAEQGHANAQDNLGGMYQNGKGVTQNDIEAANWYRKAAEQGLANAQNNLGLMYVNGKGVTKNDIEAAEWFRKAAEQGHAKAQNNLGLMYVKGKGITENDIEAAEWYRKAAEQGHADAQYHLGLMYHLGEGVTQNDIEAVEWYRKAAEQGHADAQNNLGVMYDRGKGVIENDIEAAEWYRKAAEQGHAGAYGNLGWLLITLGKFDEAQSVTEKAHQMEPQVFAWSINLGHTYLLKGDRETARRYYQKALPLIQDEASFEQGAIAEFKLFIEKGWQAKACQSELDWIRSAFKQLKLANTYNDQAAQYFQQGLFEQALPLAEQAFQIRTEILGEKHNLTLISLNHLAFIYRDLGRFSEALPLFEKGYRLSEEVLGEKHPDTLTSLNNLAYAYTTQDNINKAIKHYEKFVQGVETLLSGDLSAENLFKKWEHGYFRLSELYIDQSRPGDAFRLAEMSKARTLAAKLGGLTKAEQQKLQEYDQLSEVQIISAKEGAKSLPADAVLISYLTYENSVLAFTLQANGTLTARDLGEIPSLEKDLENTKTLSRELGKRLLEPLKDIIKDKPHWIISPSGTLALIPFETLHFEGEKEPVIAQHQISYVQSLSVCLQTPSQAGPLICDEVVHGLTE
jgi:TPR repeat protein